MGDPAETYISLIPIVRRGRTGEATTITGRSATTASIPKDTADAAEPTASRPPCSSGHTNGPQYGCKVEKRVKRIQYMLNKLGYDVKADGYFGMDCKEALMKFQDDHGLHADGVAGPTTIEKLIRTFGTDKYVDKYL